MKKTLLFLAGIFSLILILACLIPQKSKSDLSADQPTATRQEPEVTVALPETTVREDPVTTPVSSSTDPAHTENPVAGGFCTDTITWTLSPSGILTISGSGAIPNFEKGANNQPWVEYRKSVTALVVEDGITRIGDRAFQSFSCLERAVISRDVTSIGQWAFQNCYALSYVDLLPSAKLETGAFRSAPVEWEICSIPSEAYFNSSYYAALCQVALTGNYREDIINIALSQVGYHEGNSDADLGGNSDGSGDYTEYGKCMGSPGSAWCSEFASWCIRNAGVPTSMIANSRAANVAGFTAYTSADFYTWDTTSFGYGSYLPKKGDLILWSWDGAMHGTEDNLSHTSILWEIQVLGNGNVQLTTIDGNSNNQVQVRTYEVSAADGQRIGKTGLVCYIIAPDYEG